MGIVRPRDLGPGDGAEQAGGDLLDGSNAFGLACHDHLPMIPYTPTRGSLCVGIARRVQAHFALDKALGAGRRLIFNLGAKLIGQPRQEPERFRRDAVARMRELLSDVENPSREQRRGRVRRGDAGIRVTKHLAAGHPAGELLDEVALALLKHDTGWDILGTLRTV